MHHHRHFRSALIVVVISIFVFAAAFFTESARTGFVVSENEPDSAPSLSHVLTLDQLGQGTYYIDSDAIIYWMDDSSRPAVAKFDGYHPTYAGLQFYVSSDGTVKFI